MLRIFYESVVASPFLCAVACWGSRLRGAEANRLSKLIGKASDVVGTECDSDSGVREEVADEAMEDLGQSLTPDPFLDVNVTRITPTVIEGSKSPSFTLTTQCDPGQLQ